MPDAELDKWHDIEKRCYIFKRARSICFAESEIFLFLKRVVIANSFISFSFADCFRPLDWWDTGEQLHWCGFWSSFEIIITPQVEVCDCILHLRNYDAESVLFCYEVTTTSKWWHLDQDPNISLCLEFAVWIPPGTAQCNAFCRWRRTWSSCTNRSRLVTYKLISKHYREVLKSKAGWVR